MTGFGGMISLDLGDPARARRFVEATRIFALAESLGGVESLIGHPASHDPRVGARRPCARAWG